MGLSQRKQNTWFVHVTMRNAHKRASKGCSMCAYVISENIINGMESVKIYLHPLLLYNFIMNKSMILVQDAEVLLSSKYLLAWG